jgi:tetratricopeptide (TPR) repeat protein
LTRTLRLVIPFVALLSAPAAQAAAQSQLDADPALFTVMTAINCGGYDADLNSTSNHPLRHAVRQYVASKNPPSLAEVKRFFAAHRKPNPESELSQYISYALSIEGPPDFKYRFQPDELPPDVIPLAGFNELLARFYKEADLDALWQRVQPEYEKAIAAYQIPVTNALMQANAYLRNPTSGFLGRRFQIYIDLLAAPHQVQTRSYKDDFYVVVTPSPEPQTEQVRHSYLHYLLDPVAMKYSEQLAKIRGIADYAQAAPALDDAYKNDYILLATECLIKAVESRLEPGGAAKKQALVDEALREGYTMTPAFAELLPVYEKQDQAFRLYFPDLIKGVDLRKEEARLANVSFVSSIPKKLAKIAPPPPAPALTGARKTLEEAEDRYRARKLDAAKQAYLEAMRQTDEKTLHARAYYGLARIAALERDPELAQKLFEKTLELNPDAEVEAWSRVYLGRLADARQDRTAAMENYKAALSVRDAPPAARQAAERGLAQSFTKPKE